MMYDLLCKMWDIIKYTIAALALIGLIKAAFFMPDPEPRPIHVVTYEEVRASIPADDWQDFLENGGWYVFDLPREADLNK